MQNETTTRTTEQRKKKKTNSIQSGNSFLWYSLIKLVALGGIVFFVYLSFAGKGVSDTDFETMKKGVVAAVDTGAMIEADNQMIKRLYGIDPNEYDGVVLYYPSTNMGAEEVFLAKLKSAEQREEVKAAIEGRLASQKKSFDGYGTNQTELLNNSVVRVEGNYALFVVAEDPTKASGEFTRLF